MTYPSFLDVGGAWSLVPPRRDRARPGLRGRRPRRHPRLSPRRQAAPGHAGARGARARHRDGARPGPRHRLTEGGTFRRTWPDPVRSFALRSGLSSFRPEFRSFVLSFVLSSGLRPLVRNLGPSARPSPLAPGAGGCAPPLGRSAPTWLLRAAPRRSRLDLAAPAATSPLPPGPAGSRSDLAGSARTCQLPPAPRRSRRNLEAPVLTSPLPPGPASSRPRLAGPVLPSAVPPAAPSFRRNLPRRAFAPGPRRNPAPSGRGPSICRPS